MQILNTTNKQTIRKNHIIYFFKAYEKGHQRPALTVYTFQNPEIISETQKSPANLTCRPPLPIVSEFL